MKYGEKYMMSNRVSKPSRYCRKCNYMVCLSKFSVKQKGNKKQTHCDYCLGVALWEEDV